MAFEGRVIHPVAFAKIEFPDGDARICDGGFCYFGGEKYTGKDPVWGALSEVQPIEEGTGDMAPGGQMTFLPNPETPATTLNSRLNQNSRFRVWFGEIGADGKTVENAELLLDGLIDTTMVRVGRGQLFVDVTWIARADKLFSINEGNTLSPTFHKRLWPGELGLDNANGAQRSSAWGTESPSRGTVSFSSGGGGLVGVGVLAIQD